MFYHLIYLIQNVAEVGISFAKVSHLLNSYQSEKPPFYLSPHNVAMTCGCVVCRRGEAGSGGLHLLRCAGGQGLLIQRLEHHPRMLRRHPHCTYGGSSFVYLNCHLYNVD